MSNVKWQRKIPHIDEMDQDETERLFDGPVEVSEKIDGQNLSFGIDQNGRLFTKTKRGKPAYDATAHAEIPYLEGFERFHLALESVEQEVWTPVSVHFESFQVFGELLPYTHTNTIEYDSRFFGDYGLLVLFDVFMDEERPSTYIHLLQNVAKSITRHTRFNAMEKSIRVLDDLEWNDKNDLLDVLRRRSSIGADEPEGYVLRNMSNDSIAKVVDRDQFSEKNKDMHRFSSTMESVNRDLKVKVRKHVFDNADVLTNKSKTKEKVVEELAARREDGFKNSDAIFEAIIRDLDSEGHVKPYDECLEVYTNHVSEWIKEASKVKQRFSDTNTDTMGQIPTVVANHKIEKGWSRILDLTETFMMEESLVPLVKIALGPTRTHWLQDEFLK